MHDAMDVARYLVRVGYDPDSPGESALISPLRLQKLLYFCQGWSLALLGRPLFRQSMEAWKDGPVVRDVYARFAGSSAGIEPDEIGEPTEPFSAVELSLVELVWRECACLRPQQLVDKTHDEPAWREARGDLPPSARGSTPLSLETMKRHFTEVGESRTLAKKGFPPISPADVWRAEDEFERYGRRSVPAADVFARLLSEAS